MTDQGLHTRSGHEPDLPDNPDAGNPPIADEQHVQRRTGIRSVTAPTERSFWVALGAVVLLLAIALTVFVERMPTTYAATSIVALRSGGSTDVPADEQKLLAGEYAVFLSSEANVDSVTGSYQRQLRAGNVAVTVDPNTTTLRIVVTTKDRKTSVAVANGVASLAVSRGQDDARAQLLTLAKATDSTTVTGPKRTLYLGAGLILLAVAAGSVIYLKRRPS